MHREAHQKLTSSEHKAQARDEGLNAQCLSPDITRAGARIKNPLQHWASLVFLFCLPTGSVYLPPQHGQSNVELGHISWRNKRWKTPRKKGWAGGCQGLWLQGMELQVMQSHLCLQHRCTLRAWHLMDISSNATPQSLCSSHIYVGKQAKLQKESHHFDGRADID